MGQPIVVHLSGFYARPESLSEPTVRPSEPPLAWFSRACLSAIGLVDPDHQTQFDNQATRFTNLPEGVQSAILDVSELECRRLCESGSQPWPALESAMELFINETNYIADRLQPEGGVNGQ